MKNWLPALFGSGGAGHGEHPFGVGPVVELLLQAVTGPAQAVAARVAALNDEILDDTVKQEPVEITLLGEGQEGIHGIRCHVIVERHRDGPLLSGHYGIAKRFDLGDKRSGGAVGPLVVVARPKPAACR